MKSNSSYESHIKEKRKILKIGQKKGYAFPFAKFAPIDLFPMVVKNDVMCHFSITYHISVNYNA
jgi:hypothetical protein